MVQKSNKREMQRKNIKNLISQNPRITIDETKELVKKYKNQQKKESDFDSAWKHVKRFIRQQRKKMLELTWK